MRRLFEARRATRSAVGRSVQRAARAAVLVGLVASFVAAVEMVLWVRLDLLLDVEPSWLVARLVLALTVVAIAGTAGVLGTGTCLIIARSPLARRESVALPLRRSTVLWLGATAIAIGTVLRLAGAETIPGPLWVDDVSEVMPALALSGGLSDTSSWTYPVPFAAGQWGGSVGTLYLELFRLCLKAFGTTMAGIRAPSILGGVLSLLTAALLGRAFLPAGGGALTALVLAGLRWQIIMSHWGWNAMFLAPVLDVAALLMLEGRRRRRPELVALSGAVAGLGAHIHLSAWVGSAALCLWAMWPSQADPSSRRRLVRPVVFVAGFALVVTPLLQDPWGRYFARLRVRTPLGHFGSARSMWPPIETAAAALTGPWWTPDPFSRHDLPDRSRLGWVIGVAVGAAFLRAVLTPRNELSGFLLASAVAAFASSMFWGRAGTPNGYRYCYLTTTTAVAASSGALWLLSVVRLPTRRVAAALVIGLFAVAGAFGARDALVLWPSHTATFGGFHGQDSLLGRAAARWERYGPVAIDLSLADSPIVVDAVRRYRLDPDADRQPDPLPRSGMHLRIVRPQSPRAAADRIVERVRDGSGREWALVLARRAAPDAGTSTAPVALAAEMASP